MSGWPTDRAILLNRDMSYAGDLKPNETHSRLRIEEINGPHELKIVTTRVLTEGMRVLTVDGTGKWREHVVYKPDDAHARGDHAIGTYECIWSLQYDLMTSYAENHAEPGMGSSCTAAAAVRCALDGQSLWAVGACDVPAVEAGKGCVMIGISAWGRLSLVVDTWGGEVDAEIVVSATRVVERRVRLLSHVGSSVVTRRFDWAEDLTSINRKADPGPYYCRIIPLGRGQREYAEDDETEFDWPLDISEETPDGRVYIQDDEAAAVFRTKSPDGTWHYPSKVVNYNEDDPELLLAAGNADLHNHTRPEVSYEANVLQYVQAGMDAHGIALGDNIQCADFGFNPDVSLLVEGRVMRMEVEELAPNEATKLTIGSLGASLPSTVGGIVGQIVDAMAKNYGLSTSAATIVYLDELLDQINREINGTGGYTFLVSGEGAITYDAAVSDPLVGSEATRVTQMKGGSIRFAKTKKPGFSGINDWNWTNVITPEGYIGLAATIARITTGFLGNANGTYIDLDENTANFGPTNGYHFTVDTNGIKYWYGTVLLGQYLSTSMQLGKSNTSHISVNTSGMEVFDGSGVSEAVFNATAARVGRSDKAHVTITPNAGIELFDSNSTSVLFAGLSGGNSIVRVGKASGSGNVVMSSEGYVDVRNASTVMAHFGYGDTIDEVGTTRVAPYYDIGIRKAGTNVGSWSVAEGNNTTASYGATHAEGLDCVASAAAAHAEGDGCVAQTFASHAEGYGCVAGTDYGIPHLMEGTCHAEGIETKATNGGAHSEGSNTEANGYASHASGYYTIAYGDFQTAVGKFNVICDDLFVTGNGRTNSSRSNAFCVSSNGDIWCAGTLTQNSDRRLKEHHAYLGEDACDFIRKLKPALYTKDGGRHVGFYAQDVQEAEPDGWDTETVTARHTTEAYDFDPLTLDYNALIAPLVAYAQQLEHRINQQQSQIDQLTERLSALEGRMP